MSWAVLTVLLAGLVLALLALRVRRAESAEMLARVEQRRQARETGSSRARLQYPHPDLSRCIGCGTCVAACPEEGVLEVIHGQVLVVHGARCVGHGLCAEACPVDALALTLGDLSGRDDLPALTESLEAAGQPGLFLAGELTGFALVRTAITHGTAVAREVAQRKQNCQSADGVHKGNGSEPPLDLCIVGAGPAGLACSLEAKRQGLRFVTIDSEELGGTVAKYPRRKLVMTQPVELPLHGRLARTSYEKEELIELWQGLAREHELPIRGGTEFLGLEPGSRDGFRVQTSGEPIEATSVCLALGRRGRPRKLGIPGEELPKVLYSLLDAQSYRGCRVLVVGGGDSAVEAALGLARQPGNEVTLSYRRGAFSRLKARNQAAIQTELESGRIRCLWRSRVLRIDPEQVELEVEGQEPGGQPARHMAMTNDVVFVFAGGTPPFPLLRDCGISFDPADRPTPELTDERGAELMRALGGATALALALLVWLLAFREYYILPQIERPGSAHHDLLRPSGPIGLGFGTLALILIGANLAYLMRRSPRFRFRWGSLRRWMGAHVLTGIAALLCVLPHTAMAPRQTVGGHALAALIFLVLTGAIGRFIYAFVPRAANGRELALDEVRERLAAISGEWDLGQRAFADEVRARIEALIGASQWRTTLPRRLWALLAGQRRLSRELGQLSAEARTRGLSADQVDAVLALARRAHREALAAAHYEDLRGLIASWRYFHRWVALLMVLLIAVHVFTAIQYGDLWTLGTSR